MDPVQWISQICRDVDFQIYFIPQKGSSVLAKWFFAPIWMTFISGSQELVDAYLSQINGVDL